MLCDNVSVLMKTIRQSSEGKIEKLKTGISRGSEMSVQSSITLQSLRLVKFQ